jgi:hypothetical protein
MKVFLLACMLFLLWAISCNKDNDKETPGLTIVYGSACGWCAGIDSLIITESGLNYRKMHTCDHHAFSKVTHIGKSEWDKLNASFSREDFDAIHLNSCNVCVDGCDLWITVRDGSYFHKIRFGSVDEETLQPIKPLVNMLDSLMQIYRPASEKK